MTLVWKSRAKVSYLPNKRKNLFETQAEWGFSLVEKEKELLSKNRQLLLSSFWIAYFLPRVYARRKKEFQKLSSNNSLILALKFDFSIFQLVRKNPEFGLRLEIYISSRFSLKTRFSHLWVETAQALS